MRRSFIVLAGTLGLACRSSQAPSPPPAPTLPEPARASPAGTEPEAIPATHAGGGVDGEAHDHVDPRELNARYREDTDVATWRARFERDDREVKQRKPAVLDELALRPGMVVADVGAGTGLYTFDFARAVEPGGHVFAVDVQDYFLEDLQDQARQRGLENVEAVSASQTSVSLPPASVDLAFLCDVYHHIEQPEPYLESLYAAIRPEGHLVVIDYARTDQARPFIKRHIRADPATFRAEIEAAGFRFEGAPSILEENFMFVFRRP